MKEMSELSPVDGAPVDIVPEQVPAEEPAKHDTKSQNLWMDFEDFCRCFKWVAELVDEFCPS